MCSQTSIRRLLALLLCVMGAPASSQQPAHATPVAVVGGSYTPFYPSTPGERVVVHPFGIDPEPVTNGAFLAFVREHPNWQRGQVPELFAEPTYLSHWAGPLALGGADAAAPVVFVSWYAAAAYCEAAGGQLPSEQQWEFIAAQSGAPVADLLAWYAHPSPGTPSPLGPAVAGDPAVRGLLGHTWEWVLDFNASLVSSDNRRNFDKDANRFCGGGSVGASDVKDYATFMRVAFRSSLQAPFAIHNLTFRCVYP